jgi:hypothetical protein
VIATRDVAIVGRRIRIVSAMPIPARTKRTRAALATDAAGW